LSALVTSDLALLKLRLEPESRGVLSVLIFCYPVFPPSIIIESELLHGLMFCFSEFLVVTLRLCVQFVASPTHTESDDPFCLQIIFFAFSVLLGDLRAVSCSVSSFLKESFLTA
jgi:hypothetical protein